MFHVNKQVWLTLWLLSLLVCVCVSQDVDISADFIPALAGFSDTRGDEVESSGDVECRRCPPGHRLLQTCDWLSDTRCGECPEGSFNLYFTLDPSCVACTSCPPGYYERNPCSPIQNVVCLPCDDKHGAFGNEDFLRKCEATTTIPPTTTTTTTTTPPPPPPTTTRTTTPPSTDTASQSPVPTLKPVRVEPTTFITTREQVLEKETDKQPDPVIEVLTSTSESPVSQTTPDNNSSLILVGQIQEEVAASAFYWPVIVGGLLAALVFLIIGMLISRAILRYRERKNKRPIRDLEDPDIQTAMLGSSPYKPRFEGDEVDYRDEEKTEPTDMIDPLTTTPLLVSPPVVRETALQNGVGTQPSSHGNGLNHRPREFNSQPRLGSAPTAVKKRPAPPPPQKHSWFQLPRLGKKRRLYNSRELNYMDEHSDDEIVQNLGRPPSVNYKEKRKKYRLLSGGGLLGRAGRRKDHGKLSRSSSYQSQVDSIKEESSFIDDTSSILTSSEAGICDK